MTMLPSSITTITSADAIAGLLDTVAHALADAPGRTPQDAQVASCLLAYTMSGLHSAPSRATLTTLERRGVDPCEAQIVAQALHGLSLRLGAWLGRAER